MKRIHRTIHQFEPPSGGETRSMEAAEEENDEDYIPAPISSSESEYEDSYDDTDDNEEMYQEDDEDSASQKLKGDEAVEAWKQMMGGITQPEEHPLARKRKLKENRGTGRKKITRHNKTDPKSIHPRKVVAEFPNDSLQVVVWGGTDVLHCKACRSTVALKRCAVIVIYYSFIREMWF